MPRTVSHWSSQRFKRSVVPADHWSVDTSGWSALVYIVAAVGLTLVAIVASIEGEGGLAALGAVAAALFWYRVLADVIRGRRARGRHAG